MKAAVLALVIEVNIVYLVGARLTDKILPHSTHLVSP